MGDGLQSPLSRALRLQRWSASNQKMEQTASGRYNLPFDSVNTYPVAMCPLICSHPLAYRYPRGLSVYVAIPQIAPFARGSSSWSR